MNSYSERDKKTLRKVKQRIQKRRERRTKRKIQRRTKRKMNKRGGTTQVVPYGILAGGSEGEGNKKLIYSINFDYSETEGVVNFNDLNGETDKTIQIDININNIYKQNLLKSLINHKKSMIDKYNQIEVSFIQIDWRSVLLEHFRNKNAEQLEGMTILEELTAVINMFILINDKNDMNKLFPDPPPPPPRPR